MFTVECDGREVSASGLICGCVGHTCVHALIGGMEVSWLPFKDGVRL